MSSEVFHEGEIRVQQRVGVAAEADRNGPMIGARIPKGAVPFLQRQSLLVFAVHDDDALWCLPVAGQEGWISADRDSMHLDLRQGYGAVDGRILRASEQNQKVGCLALDFATRRRIRINGRLEKSPGDMLVLRVAEAFPNCPKYITGRRLVWSDEAMHDPVRDGGALTGRTLTEIQRSTLRSTDIFFIASQHPRRGLDASHRGGNPGFVEVLGSDTLRFPDYPGNNLFNTLGNLEVDSRVGLLVPDFNSARALSVTGVACVSYEDHGRTRWVTVTVRSWTEVQLPATETMREPSPFNPA